MKWERSRSEECLNKRKSISFNVISFQPSYTHQHMHTSVPYIHPDTSWYVSVCKICYIKVTNISQMLSKWITETDVILSHSQMSWIWLSSFVIVSTLWNSHCDKMCILSNTLGTFNCQTIQKWLQSGNSMKWKLYCWMKSFEWLSVCAALNSTILICNFTESFRKLYGFH